MASAAHQTRQPATWPLPAAERSLVTALSEVVTAGHRVITDRLEISLLELRAVVDAGLTTAAQLLFALVLFAAAWLALSGAMALALAERLSPPLSLLVVAVANAALAGSLVAAAARTHRRARRLRGGSNGDANGA